MLLNDNQALTAIVASPKIGVMMRAAKAISFDGASRGTMGALEGVGNADAADVRVSGKLDSALLVLEGKTKQNPESVLGV